MLTAIDFDVANRILNAASGMSAENVVVPASKVRSKSSGFSLGVLYQATLRLFF